MANDIYKRRVKEAMSRDVVSLNSNDTVHEALNLLVENRVSTLPVVDRRNHCVGILSTTDLVDLTRDVDDDMQQADLIDPASRGWLIDKIAHTLGDEKVDSLMTEEVATISNEATLVRASREMLRNQVHHLPVVDAQDQVVGIISTMDILAEFVDSAPTE